MDKIVAKGISEEGSLPEWRAWCMSEEEVGCTQAIESSMDKIISKLPKVTEAEVRASLPTPDESQPLEVISKAPGAPRKRPQPYRQIEDDVMDQSIRRRLDAQFSNEAVMDPMSAESEARETEMEVATCQRGTSVCFLIESLEEYYEFENAVALYVNEPKNFLRCADRMDAEAPKGEFPPGFSFDCPLGLWRCYEARRMGFAAACMHCFGPRVELAFAERMKYVAAPEDPTKKPDIKKLYPFFRNDCFCIYDTEVIEALVAQNDVEKAEGEWKKMIKIDAELASAFLINFELASLVMTHYDDATSFKAFRNSLDMTYLKNFQTIYDEDGKRIYRTATCCIGSVPMAIRLYESSPHMTDLQDDINRVGYDKLVYRYVKEALLPFKMQAKTIPMKAEFIFLIVPDEKILTPF